MDISPDRAVSSKASGEAPSEDVATQEKAIVAVETPKVALYKQLWLKSGLNTGVLIAMLKGGLPPTIAIALFQLDSFAETFTTIGYLVAIMSLLSLAMLPRAKFFQTMIFNIIGVLIGACVALLTCYSSVMARKHTTTTAHVSSGGGPTPGTQTVTYNSSASAVSAVWLFFNIAISNTFRFKRPQLQIPVVMYSIFAMVSGTYAPEFPTMAVSEAFVKKLVEAFLAGFGIATIVNLFVIPVSSRLVVFKQSAAYLGLLQGVIAAQKGYLQSMESKDVIPSQEMRKGNHVSKAKEAADLLKKTLGKLTELHGKLHGDLTFAKREMAYGKLNAKDMDKLFDLFRQIILPLLGLGSVVDIFERVATSRGWLEDDSDNENLEASQRAAKKEAMAAEQAEWNEIMRSLHKPFEAMAEAMITGLQHASYALELVDKPKKTPSNQSSGAVEGEVDIEARGDVLHPGDSKFGEYLERKIKNFQARRKESLKIWCEQKGGNTADVPLSLKRTYSLLQRNDEFIRDEKSRQQLYLILFLEYLLWSTGLAILDLVKYADSKVEDGTMKRNRLILPGRRRLQKWLIGALGEEDTTADHMLEQSESGVQSISLGQSFQKRKDPEHLPPANLWERIGSHVLIFAEFFASPELAFGFRVACATMCIAIVAFLEKTQVFFYEQRLVWAMIMVAIGMTMTTGSGAFGLIARVAGTLLATASSLIIWYVAGGDGNTAGVIVLLFIFTAAQIYVLSTFPKFTVGIMIAMVTQVLILGYELEVRKLGVKVATSNGQLYYPVYLLAPYRLATVAAGCLIAWIWSYIPYPITAKSVLRRELGKSLYLLANFYSVVHVIVTTRLNGEGGDLDDKNSPERRLEKAKTKILNKQLSMLAQLRQHSAFTVFEPSLGGKFPRATYDAIIQEVQNILNYMSLISYSTRTFATPVEGEAGREWGKDFARVASQVDLTSNQVTSLLTLVSNSMINGTPLPPYLQAPPPYALTEKLWDIDPDILSLKHILEPGYAAFSVSQIASKMINDDLEKLLKNVTFLVGEVDFSFHILSTENVSKDSLPLADGPKGKQD